MVVNPEEFPRKPVEEATVGFGEEEEVEVIVEVIVEVVDVKFVEKVPEEVEVC